MYDLKIKHKSRERLLFNNQIYHIISRPVKSGLLIWNTDLRDDLEKISIFYKFDEGICRG